MTDLLRRRACGLDAGDADDCNDAAWLADDPGARPMLGRNPTAGRAAASRAYPYCVDNAREARSLVRV